MVWPEIPEDLPKAWALRIVKDWWDSITPYSQRNLSFHDTVRLRIMVEQAVEHALAKKKPPFMDFGGAKELETLSGEHWWEKTPEDGRGSRA